MEKTFHMLLYRAFHAQRGALRPCLAEVGLGTGQPKLLGYLSQHGPSRQRQLADYFEIDPAAVCRMLDSLEKGGFVTRCGDGRDKRRERIEITPAGRNAYDAWRNCCRTIEERMLEGFTPEERERFAGYLSRAYRNLKTAGEGRS
ncbi:MarR family winged helix-turn-helix transcriptional regulator [Flavonifractor sp. An4]|uniref:MarR family winged helix-turn-helix transcriptional regulator n=1 Tax=Flavonifractor sp. An4 TaxID=1965634 RepID=UPI000B37FF91|nr:MarR family winged helix-turn-helix transcriptional regulator [Flavonifractor sp. An4]OUO17938.1 MarR family transcriptional regulator [Flavonifractor sp. An4]